MGMLEFFIFKIFGEGNFAMPYTTPPPPGCGPFSSSPLLMFGRIWLQDLPTLRERESIKSVFIL